MSRPYPLRPAALAFVAFALGALVCLAASWLLSRRTCCAPPPPRPAAARPTPLAAAARSVLSLDVEDAAGAKSFGAAIVLAPGRLVTAAHVAQPGARLTAILPDGMRRQTQLVGRDEVADVAVLSVEGADDLAPARFAAAPPGIGERVAAVGDPLGYRGTITEGVVSSPARAYGATNPYDHIQHDAALNPGSSGGALFNAAGEVVGMNVAIADGSRRHVGIGLALPAATVLRVAEALAREGRVARPRLGLRLREAADLGAAGAPMIEDVEPDSPAAKAGARAGQRLLAANGAPVLTARDLARALEPLAPGATLALDLLEGDTRVAVTARLAELEPPQATRRLAGKRKQADEAPALRHGLELAEGAARLARVAPDSPAAAAGLKPGDELLAIGERPVDAASAAATLAGATGRKLALLVRRDGASRYVVLGEHGRTDSPQPFGANAEAEGSASL